MNYKSILFIARDKTVEIYENGLPIGVVRDKVFQVHSHTMADGSKVAVKTDPELLANCVKFALEID